ncbi:MAG: hypothetical protein R6W97_05400 [Thiobacillus sp.]
MSDAVSDPRAPAPAAPTKQPVRKRANMHDGIAVWCDCCSCAAEPYWLAVAEEMGIDLGSDYEVEAPPAHSGST